MLFKDREFIESKEGLIFCVVGYVHPRDRVIAYLKYLPSSEGKWSSGSTNYNRAMKYYSASEVVKNIYWLEKHYRQYIFNSKIFGFKMSAVPRRYILKHHIPQEGLEEIRKRGPQDPLEQKALDLVDLLSERSRTPKCFFGITGSILLGIHNPSFSDIDLIVYGREQSAKVREALLSLYEEGSSDLKRLQGVLLEKWCQEKAEAYPVSISEAAAIYARKWNYALYRGTAFSIHPTRLDQEVRFKYGLERFRSLGFARIKAKVKTVVEDLYSPYIYELTDVEVEEGTPSRSIYEVVSYEGFYGVLKEGERVAAYGKVEEVQSTAGRHHLRMLIGSPEAGGRDFLKPLDLYTTK